MPLFLFPQVKFIAGKAEEEIERLFSSDGTTDGEKVFTVAVLDPPRTGLDPSVCTALRANANVDRVLFISCNAAGKQLRRDYVVQGGTFLENALILCQPPSDDTSATPAFAPVVACGVDMFPYTTHFEVMMVFDRLR